MAGNAKPPRGGQGGGQGRRPTPPALRLLEGRTPGHDSGGRPVPIPAPFVREAPEKPEGMTEAASHMWDYIVDHYGELKLLKALDGPPLEALAETWSRFQDAKAMRIKLGQMMKAPNGEVRIAPWAKLEAQTARDLRCWFTAFAMGPVAEVVLASNPKDSEGESNPFSGTG